MGEGLGWVLGFICCLFATIKILGGIWCLVEWRRNWRGAFELWGVDWLVIVYRLRVEFGVALTDADFSDWSPEERTALTAGELGEIVAARIRGSGCDVPTDGWDRVVAVLCESLHTKPSRIVWWSRLYADLGMFYGLD
jgi:hypothetical protein